MVAERIVHKVKQATVLHLSVHTFTPVFDGEVRKTDVGLLFDERRSHEASLCASWQMKLKARLPAFQIDLNKPYLGSDDGFTTFLRTLHPPDRYLGIELEVNQKWCIRGQWEPIVQALSQTLTELIGH